MRSTQWSSYTLLHGSVNNSKLSGLKVEMVGSFMLHQELWIIVCSMDDLMLLKEIHVSGAIVV